MKQTTLFDHDPTVDASGLVDFVSFTESGDVVAGLTTGAQPMLRFNGGAPVVGELGPVKLGDLEITSAGEGTRDLQVPQLDRG